MLDPLIVNGTVTSSPLCALSNAVTVIVPDSPAPDDPEVKVTFGVASSSLMVAVWVVVAPLVAFVGVPISTTTVSSFSSSESKQPPTILFFSSSAACFCSATTLLCLSRA